MKKEVSPAVVGVIIVVLLAVVGFVIFKGTGGGGGKAPGEVGNASPFAPGGAAAGKGAKPAESGGR